MAPRRCRVAVGKKNRDESPGQSLGRRLSLSARLLGVAESTISSGVHPSLLEASRARLPDKAAAFFDLDHTLIKQSTPIALAGTFRRHRLIRRRDLLRAAAWHLIFLLRGLGETAVRKSACEGMVLLRGIPVVEIETMMGEAMEQVLRPLVYAEPLALLDEHRRRNERAFVLSASLHEVVLHIALDLGFDGAIGSTCEIQDGVYTGKGLEPCYGEYKAKALRELAAREGIDLVSSTAYSDSHTDLAFLEAVGNPVAVNPDRKLRRTARDRGWPTLEFGEPRRRLTALQVRPLQLDESEKD